MRTDTSVCNPGRAPRGHRGHRLITLAWLSVLALLALSVGLAGAAPAPKEPVGKWMGTLTFTEFKIAEDIPVPDIGMEGKNPAVVKKDECEGLMNEGLNEPSDLTMLFEPETEDSGTVVITSNTANARDENPMPLPYRVDGDTVTIGAEEEGVRILLEGKLAEKAGKLVLEGTVNFGMEAEGLSLMEMRGNFSVSKAR